MNQPAIIRELEVAHGVDRLGPIVSFYDHALPANQSARDFMNKGKFSGERPRFKPAVFVKKTTRNDPTNSTFTQPVTEQDKEMHPREWALYCELKEKAEDRSPPIAAIPGMDAVSMEELKALGISDCKQLIEYQGDLDSIEHLRETAKRIMEIAHESRGVRAQGQTVPQGMERPANGFQPRTSGYAHIAGNNPESFTVSSANQSGEALQNEAAGKRQVPNASVEVFNYEFAA